MQQSNVLFSELYRDHVILIHDDLPIVSCFTADGNLVDAYFFGDFDDLGKGIEVGKQIVDKMFIH